MSYPTREDSEKLIHRALKDWNNLDNGSKSLLEEFYLIRQERSRLDGSNNYRECTNQVLESCLHILGESEPQSEEVIKKRFIEGNTTLNLVHTMNLSQDQINRKQKQAIKTLADIFYNRDSKYRDAKKNKILARIDSPSYNRVFGMGGFKDQALANLMEANTPPILMITGIGGIGKTTLANIIVREIIDTWIYDEILWLRVEFENSDKSFFNDLLQTLARIILPNIIPEINFEHAISWTLSKWNTQVE